MFYRRLKQRDTHFLNYFKDTLKIHSKENKKIKLTGDFNLNLAKFDKSKK